MGRGALAHIQRANSWVLREEQRRGISILSYDVILGCAHMVMWLLMNIIWAYWVVSEIPPQLHDKINQVRVGGDMAGIFNRSEMEVKNIMSFLIYSESVSNITRTPL